MEIKTCNYCHRIFNSATGSSTCPNCFSRIEGKFKEVKQFIRKNPRATIVEVSEACEVTIGQVRDWIKDERIEYTKGSKIGIECEKCGVTILTGKYCDKCKNEINLSLKKIYNHLETNQLQYKKQQDPNNRMRFLNKKKDK